MAESIMDKCPFNKIVEDTFAIGYGEDTWHAALRAVEAWIKENTGREVKQMDKDEQLELVQRLGMHVLRAIQARVNNEIALTVRERYGITREDMTQFSQNQVLDMLFKEIFRPRRSPKARSSGDLMDSILDEVLRSRFRF